VAQVLDLGAGRCGRVTIAGSGGPCPGRAIWWSYRWRVRSAGARPSWPPSMPRWWRPVSPQCQRRRTRPPRGSGARIRAIERLDRGTADRPGQLPRLCGDSALLGAGAGRLASATSRNTGFRSGGQTAVTSADEVLGTRRAGAPNAAFGNRGRL